MRADCPVGDEEPSPDFAIGQAGSGHVGDLEFRRREAVACLRDPAPARLAGCAQFLACPFAPCKSTERIEGLARGAQGRP